MASEREIKFILLLVDWAGKLSLPTTKESNMGRARATPAPVSAPAPATALPIREQIKVYVDNNRDLPAKDVIAYFVGLGNNESTMTNYVSLIRKELGLTKPRAGLKVVKGGFVEVDPVSIDELITAKGLAGRKVGNLMEAVGLLREGFGSLDRAEIVLEAFGKFSAAG